MLRAMQSYFFVQMLNSYFILLSRICAAKSAMEENNSRGTVAGIYLMAAIFFRGRLFPCWKSQRIYAVPAPYAVTPATHRDTLLMSGHANHISSLTNNNYKHCSKNKKEEFRYG